MKLQCLNDETLHKDTLNLVAHERSASVKILHHVKEIDRRKLYSDFKCSSLFDYSVNILDYSEASAQRRIVAARMIADNPEIEKKVEKGALSLTNLSQVNHFFRENQITSKEEKNEILKRVENLSKRDCEKKLFEISGKQLRVREEKKRISSDQSKVSIILSDATMAEVQKLKALLGKEVSMDELIHFMAQAAIEKIEKVKFKQTARPKRLSPAKAKRVPNAAQKREIYKRDKQCVQCGSQYNLNYDHRLPYALGGKTEDNNLRLLCFHCNQRARIKVFGTRSPRSQKTVAPLRPG